jgi:hypothetical protein
LSSHPFSPMLARAALRRSVLRSQTKIAAGNGLNLFMAKFQRNMSSGPIKIVDLEEAKKLPREFEEMSNDVITILAVLGDQEAREERLIREIMRVDLVSWKDAQPRFNEMVSANRQGMWLATLPYKIGLITAVSAAACSIPMVFDLNTTLWFNEHFVTTDVPGPEDLETPLEVGSWAWGWMEPPLGTISFVLLCLQYGRAQLGNMQRNPYTEWMRDKRARRLRELYPQYSRFIVEDFAKTDSFDHQHRSS